MTQYDPAGGGGQYNPYGQSGQAPQYPPGPGPYGPYGVPYAGPGTPARPTLQRPTSVMVLAIIGIIFGALGLFSPLAPLVYSIQIGPPNPIIRMTRDDPVLWNWMLVSSIVGFPTAVAQLAGSIGILGLRNWARKTLLVWAGVAIVMGLANCVFMLGFMVPKLMALQNNTNDPVLRTVGPSSAIGAVIGVPIAFVLPACVLYFLTRPKVKGAFVAPAA